MIKIEFDSDVLLNSLSASAQIALRGTLGLVHSASQNVLGSPVKGVASKWTATAATVNACQ
jgi:hypothetical protein